MTRRAARRLAWGTITTAILVAGYSCSGYVMVGSFSVSNPERLAEYRRAAWIYIALMVASLLAVIVASVVLARGGRDADDPTSHLTGR